MIKIINYPEMRVVDKFLLDAGISGTLELSSVDGKRPNPETLRKASPISVVSTYGNTETLIVNGVEFRPSETFLSDFAIIRTPIGFIPDIEVWGDPNSATSVNFLSFRAVVSKQGTISVIATAYGKNILVELGNHRFEFVSDVDADTLIRQLYAPKYSILMSNILFSQWLTQYMNERKSEISVDELILIALFTPLSVSCSNSYCRFIKRVQKVLEQTNLFSELITSRKFLVPDSVHNQIAHMLEQARRRWNRHVT